MNEPFDRAEARSLINENECNHDEDTVCKKCNADADEGPEAFDVANDR